MTPRSHYAGKTAYRGEIAANYDRDRVGEPIWQREQAWVESWARRLPAGAKVLDLPAGTGRFLEILWDRGARVHAIDISEDMLKALRARSVPKGASLVVTQGDAEALECADDSFDFVICWRLMHLLPSDAMERVVRELARVCRGEIVLEVLGVYVGGPWGAAARAVKRRLRALLGLRSRAGGKPWSHITNYPHREADLIALFSRCGLHLESMESLMDYDGRPARIYLLRKRVGP
jgi:ubiquinone/menaquinone biosynthesis C-methylase UbiE